jgi:hypothetical protein
MAHPGRHSCLAGRKRARHRQPGASHQPGPARRRPATASLRPL